MNAMTPIAAKGALVSLVDGEARADSRDIAAFFLRTHRSVLLAIDNAIEAEPDLALHEIMQGSFTTPETGQHPHRCYLLTRDAFSLVVMGFTGAKALKWKRAYIAAFNAMEQELRRRETTAVPDLNDPATLRGMLLGYTEKVLALEARASEAEAKVEAAKPAVDFVEALADSDGSWGLQAAGKALHQGPNRFVAWLKERGDVFELNGGNVAKQRLTDRGLFTVVWEEYGGKPRPKTKLTGRGIVHYARELGVRPPGPPSQALLPGL